MLPVKELERGWREAMDCYPWRPVSVDDEQQLAGAYDGAMLRRLLDYARQAEIDLEILLEPLLLLVGQDRVGELFGLGRSE